MDRQSESVKELVERLAAVTAAVGYVQLDGKVEFKSTRYKYATQAALIMAVREHLAKQQIAVTPSVRDVQRVETKSIKYGKEDISNDWLCVVDYTMRYGDQWICTTCPGFGQGDKGLYSAQTNAMKYWLRNTFLIATGEDAEEYDNHRQPARPTTQAPAAVHPDQSTPSAPVMKALASAALLLVEMRAFDDEAEALACIKRAAYQMAGRNVSLMTEEHVRGALAAISEERLA